MHRNYGNSRAMRWAMTWWNSWTTIGHAGVVVAAAVIVAVAAAAAAAAAAFAIAA